MPQTIPETDTVTIDFDLASEARELNIDLSQAARDGIARAIEDERRRLRYLENLQNRQAEHDFVEMRGIPLSIQMVSS